MPNQTKIKLRNQLKVDILPLLKDVEINTKDLISKKVFFLYTTNERYKFELLNFVLEVVISERFNIEDDEGPSLDIEFIYPEVADMVWNKPELIIYANYGRPKPLWFRMEDMRYKIEEIDEQVYEHIMSKIKDFINEFKEFIISEINNNY
jgi:hypothetical protein